MSTLSGGPNIVTNGLVLNLDAANAKSYVSGSTIWNDISQGGNNGTLVNGPTFNSANGGSIVFDGSNDYASIPNVGVTNLTAFSISFWAKASTPSFAYPTVYSENTPANWPNNLFIIYFADGTGASGGIRVYFGGSGIITYTTSVANDLWYNVCFVQNSKTDRVLYLNSTQIGTHNVNINHTATYSVIGANNNNGSLTQYFKGNLSNLQLYNRALSAQEVLQNYNATKTRFGL
jgi:hypothetical protein